MEQLLHELLEAGDDDRPRRSVKQIQSSRASAKGHSQQGVSLAASLTRLDETDDASASLSETNRIVALGRTQEHVNNVPTARASNRRLKKSEVRKKRRIQEAMNEIDDLLNRSDRSAVGNVTLDHTNAAPSVDVRKPPTNLAEWQLSATNAQNVAAESAEPKKAVLPGPTENVEVKVLNQFRVFADTEKQRVMERKKAQQNQDRTAKLNELLRFSKTFRLKTPIPNDLINILTKNPTKQEAIIEKAQKDHEESASAAASPSSALAAEDTVRNVEVPRSILSVPDRQTFNRGRGRLDLQQLLSRSCYGCILEGSTAYHYAHSQSIEMTMSYFVKLNPPYTQMPQTKVRSDRDPSRHLSTSFKSAIEYPSALSPSPPVIHCRFQLESAGVMSLTPLLAWDRATKLSNLLSPGLDLILLLSSTRTEHEKIQIQNVDRAFWSNDLYYWKQSSSTQALRYRIAPRHPRRDEDQRRKDAKKLKQSQAEKEAQGARIRERFAKNTKTATEGVPSAFVPYDFFRPEKAVQAPDDFKVFDQGTLGNMRPPILRQSFDRNDSPRVRRPAVIHTVKRRYVQPGPAFVAQGREIERLHDEATSSANRDAFPRVPSDATSGGPRLASKEYTSWQSSVCSMGLLHSDSMQEQIYPTPPGDDMLTGLARVEEVLSDDDVAFHSDSSGISLVSTVESEGEKSFVDASFSPHPTTDAQFGGLPDVPTSEILRGLVQDFLPQSKTLMMQGPDSSISSVSVTASKGETNRGTTSLPTSVTTISRRARSSQNDSDDDSGGGRPPKRPRLADIDLEPCPTERLLLACPHAKFNPEMYSERNTNPAQASYHKCASKILTSIARLKQHLYRVHRRPEHYCSSCYEAFRNEGDRSRHERLRTCPIIDCPFAEKMSPDQYQAIKRRRLGEDCVQAWFAIFRTLFPNARRLPDNPYVESTESLLSRRIVGEFTAFVEQEAPSRLAQRMGMPLFGTENATTLQWHLNQVLEEALPVVLAEVQHQYQLLEMARTRNTVPAGADRSPRLR
ncbi:poly(A)-binding protein binding protein [Elasticomyces elasticus]|uniref:Poly(A)-binding protein binding protein n=1 Tax=Exophiala sideris TaxID=1016849 RepID=A0ABR0JK62_9EURO|nr:poly(A)-binding protein binding protein [Elasticomyces elasticus]KAK5035398.1 poly(A)-binding protein binding protein [Exophiala sideris]KAK5039251.1 poly(A)-binding protein binding protein [Exophiala sideris]KAK5066322.1 poly(A)-binding protein binding protein [Exophiala sideris]KAK5186999.1 poly(A)-binding protein binding protein [Eurotiomycetes sp. CCFEE 6388]